MTLKSEQRLACVRCAEIKQACDGSSPCLRCVRLSVPCVQKGKGPLSVNGTTATPASSRAKAKITRVHTGCLTCKRRRKKCDEVKPKCADCRRLNLPCTWSKQRGFRHSTSDGGQYTSSSTSDASDRDPPNAIEVEEVYSVDLTGMQTAPWIRDVACNANVQRFPTEIDLQTWHDSNMTTPDTTTPIMVLEDADHSTSPVGSELVIVSPTPFPDLAAPEDRALLNHFLHVVAPILSRRPAIEDNPYRKNLLPLAAENEVVLHSILALSAKHWQKFVPELASRGTIHQSQATQSLANLLPQVDRTAADIALVSSLILCMTELFDGVSASWKYHLTGSKRLLDALLSQKRRRGMSSHHKFFVRLYRFLDSATTTSTCRPPIIEETQGQDGETAEIVQDPSTPQTSQISDDTEDCAVYGIPKPLFHLVDRVNTVAYNRKFRKDEASETDFRHQAARVEHLIDSWSYEYGSVSQAVSNLCNGDPDAYHAVNAFEWALRLRLHQIVEGYGLDNPLVDHAVNGIIDSTQQIRYGSPIEACLMFPLVMAGGACFSLEHRLIIQDRLMVMERTCGFGYVYNARELLTRVWKRREQSDSSAIVNWARIRFEEMDGLVIF